MATNEKIAFELQKAFRPYVLKKDIEKYDSEFFARKMYTSKFILQYFPKYINFKKFWKNPKQLHNALLFNYFLIEIPELGVTSTQTFWAYVRKEKQFQKKISKK